MVILPLLAFAAFFLVIWTAPSRESPPDWRHAFLLAAVLWGAVLTGITEGLSLIRGLTAGWVGPCWGLAFLGAVAWAARVGGLAQRWDRLRRVRFSVDWVGASILVGMAAVVGCLLVVAWVSPPNNTDSLQYHMSRVVHWAQDRSLRHYPTAYEPQIFQPIWAESAILHLRLLWGDDRPANLVQWFSMLGSLVGVSLIGRRLGAGGRGQLAAAAFALSVPIGILEATSTQNDYVAGFWLVCLAYFALVAAGGESRPEVTLGAAGALGLGLLTKGTFYPFCMPFGLWFLVGVLRRSGWKRAALHAAVIGGIVVLLNAGYWIRNMVTYGGPLGSPDTLASFTSAERRPAALAAVAAANLALNFPLPDPALNDRLSKAVGLLLQYAGSELPRIKLAFVWNYEDLAGNPLHVILVPVTMGILWLRRRQVRGPGIGWYALVVLAGFGLMLAVIRFDAYGVRYQLPFFLAWGPAFGVAVGSLGRRLAAGVAVCLVVVSLPWVLLNRTRPMIGWRPRTTTDSIFRTPASQLLFANWIERRDPSIAAARAVEATGCKQVGLRLDSHDWEYSFWWLLRAPQSGMRIEVLNPPPDLQRYVDTSFHPCAIVCTICGSRPRIYGLELTAAFSDVRVYAGEGYVPDMGD